MTIIEIPCDLCGSTDYSIVYPGIIPKDEIDASLFYTSSRIHAGHFPIVQCKVCSLVRSSLRDDNKKLDSIYEELYDDTYEAEAANRKRSAAAHLAWVSRFCHIPENLLDVGCSTGIFLEQALQAGWGVTGLEPSSWAKNLASQRLPGTDIFCGTLQQACFPSGSFHAITLWDVLEHIPSPSDAINQLNPWLEPSGWLFLNIPNISSVPARLMRKYWVLLLREHIWYFSPTTLQRLLEKCGFQLIATRPNQVWFSFRNIFKRLSQYQNTEINSLSSRRSGLSKLADFSIRFPMGEIKVAAQKVFST